jgi:hypothetical protein
MELDMRIPVFLSAPTSLNPEQESVRNRVVKVLRSHSLEPRALGRQEYPTDYPLREVAVIARHCSGGMILGFEQFFSTSGTWKRGSTGERPSKEVKFPTPWNNLEAGILFGLGLPLLIFREPGISGGVFDNGVTDVFVHEMPPPVGSKAENDELRQLVLRWQSRVREHYYRL